LINFVAQVIAPVDRTDVCADQPKLRIERANVAQDSLPHISADAGDENTSHCNYFICRGGVSVTTIAHWTDESVFKGLKLLTMDLIIVTGAGGGFGTSIAEKALSLGHLVAGAARSAKDAKRTAAQQIESRLFSSAEMRQRTMACDQDRLKPIFQPS
jgi:hypothetical protein